MQPLEHQAVVQRQLGDLQELGDEASDRRRQLPEGGCSHRIADTARHDGAPQQTVTGEPLVEAKQLFAKAEAVSVAEGEAGIVHDHADVADVVVQTLELEEHHPEPRRARRNLGAGQRFDRLTVGDGVGDRFVAGDAFGERRGPLEGQGFEELLRPLVDEAQTGFQIDDRLALDGEPKMAGLDDPGVHGTHGDLEQTVAVDASEAGTGINASRSWAKSRRDATSRRRGK